jgi:hypothetical protein
VLKLNKNISLFRIIPIGNLKYDLNNGFFSKLNAPDEPDRDILGNPEIISERDNRTVKCFPKTVVNNYVPFYFSVRTPMLYNIITGHGVPAKQQQDIIYLSTSINELATDDAQWCFTDGSAAKIITRFYKEVKDLKQLDWKSIRTKDFRLDNSDGDTDRIRKKHAEFLIMNHVKPDKIRSIIVLNKTARKRVKEILKNCSLKPDIHINPSKNFYF